MGNLHTKRGGGGGVERPSRDALFRTILSISTVHVTSHFDREVMEAVRISVRSERPFDEFKVIYLHCIDLDTKQFTPVTSFPCLEICCVLGHFSFPGELAVRRLCCFLWSEESKAKLAAYQSPVLLHVKSSCYFTVIIFLYVYLYQHVAGYSLSFASMSNVRTIVKYTIDYIAFTSRRHL